MVRTNDSDESCIVAKTLDTTVAKIRVSKKLLPCGNSITVPVFGPVCNQRNILSFATRGNSSFPAPGMPVIERASNFTISGNPRFYEIHGNSVINQGPDANELKRDQVITNLPRAQASRTDYETNKKSGPCFPGTRKALLQEMMDWVTHLGESKIHALSGLAGIGKTTVAYTIATEADKQGLLGASFFFSRDEADRRSAKKFFTTIAYHLCRFNEEFAQAIAEVLVTKDGYSATTGSPQEQLETLILDPLRAIVNSPQTLIVVDALDECDDEDAPSVLTGLRRIVQTLPSFKVILTTRPQPLVDNDFSTQGSHKIFHLQNIEEKVVNEDLRLYLKHSFSCEQVRIQLRSRTMEWSASDAQVESLIQASGKLFIMASMAVRYVLDRHWNDPSSRIKTLLDAFAQGHTPFDNLVDFYTIILRSAIPADCRDASLIKRYQAIVGTILFAHVPLSIHTLAHLICIEAEQIFVVLHQLQSAILVGKDDIPVICHKSFADYITDSTRCKDDNMRIDPRVCHMWITTCCFKIMNKDLKYNILSLGIPARFMSNKEGLAKDGLKNEQLQERIPQYLRYACVYWGSHLEVANVEDADFLKGLEEFAYHHMVYWFETLSLIEKLDMAHRAIHVALKRLKLKPASSRLRQLLSDAQRFISKFYETIERSALHTYYSALAFTPADTLLYQLYIKQPSHDTCDVTGVPEKWDPLIAQLDHGEYVSNNIRFSLDSTMFVSFGEGRGVLKVWEAVTGTPISTIKGSLGSRFAITNDFATIASYKDNIIILYNMNGSEQGATFTAHAMIGQVAISSENSRVAAGLCDGTLYLWDTGNGKLVGSFDDYQTDSSDSHLAFSATGARLAYRSINGAIKLRDGSDGRTIGDLNWGRGVQLVHVALSRDGSRISTLSESGQLKLWSCKDGKLVGIAKNGFRGHWGLAISADGSLLATGFENIFGNWKVRLWSGNSGKPRLSRVVDSLDVDPKSIAFSPDNILAIATSDDIRLYNVTSRSFVSTLPCYVPTSLAFSPDGSRLAAEGSSGTVYLWDIQGIEASNPSSNDQASSQVTALALSQHCSQVACGFRDGTIELREIGGSAKQRTAVHWRLWGHRKWIEALRFSPDGRQFASCSDDGTVKLWKLEGKGNRIRKTLKRGSNFYAVEVSTSLLAVVCHDDIVLLDSMTLNPVHTFAGDFWRWTRLSFSANGVLLAAVNQASASPQIFVFDVTKRTTIAMFDVSGRVIHSMAFSPDNSQLIVLFDNDNRFLSFNLVNEEPPKQPTLEDIIRLPNMPLWNGVPVWVSSLGNGEQYYLVALFPQHDVPVPVLWIPREFGVEEWAEERSMIALGCEDGRVILLQLPTSHVGN